MDPDVLRYAQKHQYGLPGSCVHWFETYLTHNRNDLNLLSTEVYLCFLYRHNSKISVEGLIWLQVDDSTGTETKKLTHCETRKLNKISEKNLNQSHALTKKMQNA